MPHEMTTEETIAFLEGHNDECFALAKQLANVISYENGVELNALRMMRLLDPVVMDKIRLDWMERNRAGAEYNDRIAAFTVQRYQQVCGCIGDAQRLRDAIDEARKHLP